jgi:hypothetical protein
VHHRHTGRDPGWSIQSAAGIFAIAINPIDKGFPEHVLRMIEGARFNIREIANDHFHVSSV